MQPSELCDLVRGNIRHYRRQSGMTQVELAKAIGTTQDHISDIERGATKPTMEMLAKISEALELAPHVLVSPRPEKKLAISP